MSTPSRTVVAMIAFAFVAAPLGCSLLAPSDQELMGGLTKESEAGSDGGGEGGNDEAGEADGACGGNNATCSSPDQCCSGKCRGNGLCL